MRTFGLAILFVVGVIGGLVAALPLFIRALYRGARAFHPRGTVCRAEIVALDDVVGPRLAGPARVRFSSSTEPENSRAQTILGFAIKVGDDQDLATATFEAFIKVNEGTANTNVADYLGNQFGSVAPWKAKGLGVVWLRAMPNPAANVPKTGSRTERLDADIAAERATFVLEAREAPGPDGPVRARVAEVRLLERLPDDDPTFRISMFRTGRGIVPTGFRNGVRSIVYPVSQFARGLRGA